MNRKIVNMNLIGTLEVNQHPDALEIEDKEGLDKLKHDYKAMAEACLNLLSCIYILQSSYTTGAPFKECAPIIEELANKAQDGLDKLQTISFTFKLEETE